MAEPSKAKKVIYAGGVCSGGMTYTHFTIRQPLVSVQSGSCSKFEDGKTLDKGVSDYLLLQVIKEMQKFGKCYSAPADVRDDPHQGVITKELGYRPVVCSIFPVFSSLAPRTGELLEGEDAKYMNRGSVGFVHEAGKEMEWELVAIDGEQLEGSTASMLGSDLSGWSFCEGRFRHEYGASLKPHEAVECKGYVLDLTLPGGPQMVARSLFEMKGYCPWRDVVPQLLNYGSAAATKNVHRGRYKKIHLVVLGIGWAGCAEIDPIGFLDIGPKNRITSAAVAKFKEHAQAKYDLLSKSTKNAKAAAALKTKYLDVELPTLVKYFKGEVKRRMDDACYRMDDACYRLNGNLTSHVYAPSFNKEDRVLVGSATYCRHIFPMMQYPVVEDSRLHEDSLVVAGIARIVFGDRVLKWTLPGLLAHATKREEEAEREAKEILARALLRT